MGNIARQAFSQVLLPAGAWELPALRERLPPTTLYILVLLSNEHIVNSFPTCLSEGYLYAPQSQALFMGPLSTLYKAANCDGSQILQKNFTPIYKAPAQCLNLEQRWKQAPPSN